MINRHLVPLRQKKYQFKDHICKVSLHTKQRFHFN
jgi:hypothetical protein